MASVSRLVTFVDVADHVADPRRMSMSMSARHEAVLADGRRVLLLDDRGWSESGPPDIWAVTSVEAVADTARTVVGPDEPFGDHSYEDIAADHWCSWPPPFGRMESRRKPSNSGGCRTTSFSAVGCSRACAMSRATPASRSTAACLLTRQQSSRALRSAGGS